MISAGAVHAASRFGLGLSRDEGRQIGNDPKSWLMAQLRQPVIPPEVKVRKAGAELTLRALKDARKNKTSDAEQAIMSMRDIYIEETGARFLAQLRSTQPFVERLVLFWSNHFTVSVQKPIVAALVNVYEVEAIRPHVSGYFKDMLIAAVQHPAMSLYLDNAQSFGAASMIGRRRDKGINENLAREILELHTLGVDGGYTQADVIALAKIITGWTLDVGLGGPRIAYAFQPRVHEPGPKTLLGRTFQENGEREGIDALSMLAGHPSTARHVATKLARHFIADQPPPDAVSAIAKAFQGSGGYLPTVMEAVLARNEAWQPLTKFKTPYEFALSALRLTDVEPTPMQAIVGLEALNFRAFNASSPAGFDDTADVWASPDAVMKRIEWAHKLAQRLPAGTDPVRLAEAGLGELMGQTTRQTIERAASGADGIALALASPEFQRR